MGDDEVMIPDEISETLPILTTAPNDAVSTVQIAVYCRRWYIAALFSFGCFLQALIANTWGPIAESSEAVFNWDDTNIGMLANYSNISYMITVLPMCYLMDVKGLRKSAIICSIIQLVGSGVRCISLRPVPATWFANVCAILNGIASTVPFAGPALVSSVWFPIHQRATATAGMSFSYYFGTAMSFIIGPVMVSSPEYKESNDTVHEMLSSKLATYKKPNNSLDHSIVNLDVLKTKVMQLNYLHVSLSAAFCILLVIYFPDKPPHPPSPSASVVRTDYVRGLKNLSCNGAVWLITLASALPTGILGTWQSTLDVNLKTLKISQVTAGYLGFYQALAGCFASLMIAKFADIFMRRMKLFLLILYICAAVSTTWFTILCNKFIPFNTISLYISCILIGVFINGGIPLFYEIACEASYPVAEGVTGGLLTLVNNLTGMCFLFILFAKSIGTSWMNWALVGSVVIALPLLFLFPERYKRTDIDIAIIVSHTGHLGVSEDKNDSVESLRSETSIQVIA